MDHARQDPSEPNLAADADCTPGPTPSAAFHGATRAGLRRVEPLTSGELIRAGVCPQLLALLALRRASGGGVAISGGHYLDYGRPMPGYLTGVFEELADTGLLAVAGEDAWGMRRVSLTPAGQARYAQLSATSGRAGLRVTDSPRSHQSPAGHRASTPVPASVPDCQPVHTSKRASSPMIPGPACWRESLRRGRWCDG